LAERPIPGTRVRCYPRVTERSPEWGRRREKGRHGVNTQLQVLRIAFAAAAALVVFLVVHSALEAFSQTTRVLAGT
jgi:hypothetical protein